MNGKGLMSPPQQDQVPGQVEGQLPQEVQDRVDMFLANGIRLVHSEKVSDGFLKVILDGPDPVMGIADATLDIVGRLEGSAGERGVSLPPEILAQVANILMGEIIKVSETAGLEPMSDEQKYQAYSLAVSKYLDQAVKSGKITPEQLQQMGAEAGQTPEGQKIVQESGGGQQMPTAQPGAMPGGV